ncbi:hypothetical protein CDIK_0098 [Cucumispora dikerogammari]|nr:hypothetical protein CDIK_0098 [Cucumispora dikerogammari]
MHIFIQAIANINKTKASDFSHDTSDNSNRHYINTLLARLSRLNSRLDTLLDFFESRQNSTQNIETRGGFQNCSFENHRNLNNSNQVYHANSDIVEVLFTLLNTLNQRDISLSSTSSESSVDDNSSNIIPLSRSKNIVFFVTKKTENMFFKRI